MCVSTDTNVEARERRTEARALAIGTQKVSVARGDLEGTRIRFDGIKSDDSGMQRCYK